MADKTYQTQIEKLKEQGLYGSVLDPQWNRETKQHDCCGSRRAYYHHVDCPLCTRDIMGESEPKPRGHMKWKNLLQNKCPGCDKDLIKTMIKTDDDSVACRCGFKCDRQKYKQICADRVSNSIDNDESENEEEPSFL